MSTMNLELQLKLQDRMSAGMKAALKAMQDGTKNARREMDGLANAANKIKPTGIERMAKALREVKSLSKSTMDMLNKTAQAGAGIAAGAYVAKRALDKPMAYDRQLALTSNVAFSDRSVAGRIAGKMELDKAVRAAQKQGMGSQEEVLQTLNDLIGSGAMGKGAAGVKSSMDMLPTIAAASSGTGANPADLAKIIMAAKQNMGMSDAEAKQFLSQAITAGNMGGFELKDSALKLPEQMAKYAALGNTGLKGGQELMALNQASKITSGTAEAAGINVTNLLNKMNAPDTQKDFKKHGINLSGSLLAGAAKGQGSLDTFMGLVDEISNKNPEYKKLQAKAAKQKGPEQQKTFDAMMAIMEQQGLGSVVQDSQAMSAALGARQNKGFMMDVRAAMQADKGGQIEANMAVVDSTASAGAERLANVKDQAASKALGVVDVPLQSMLKGITSVAEANPVLAASAYAAATALGVVAASAGIGGLFKMGKVGGVAKAGASIAGRVGLGAVGGGALAAAAMPVAAVIAAGFLGYGVGTAIERKFGDGNTGERVAKLLAAFGNEEAQQALKNAKQEIKVVVEVKNGNITAAVNQKNTKEARRH